MGKWEYRSRILHANQENARAKDYVQKNYPNWKEPPKFYVIFLEEELNFWGDKGWELVHMEPIEQEGKNGDIGYTTGGSYMVTWSNAYFCVFKRPKQ